MAADYIYLVKGGKLKDVCPVVALRGELLLLNGDETPFSTWGFLGHFRDYDSAHRVVTDNWLDLYAEGPGIPIACIFKVPQGLWISREEIWFLMNEEKKMVMQAERPKALEGYRITL